ncbi:unnamed protein product [Scytosiphon promiscuus]
MASRAGSAGVQPQPPDPYTQQETNEDLDDRFASPPGLWLPRTVVRRHRRKATMIWVGLLVGFLAYVTYIVWETVQSRKDPASSIELKQEHYVFPDVMFCTEFSEGCLEWDNDCFEIGAASLFDAYGFENVARNFTDDFEHVSAPIEQDNPNCIVIPLSKLTVNETGVVGGDFSSFYVSLFLLWPDGVESYNHEYYLINTQFINMYFIDVDGDVYYEGDRTVDAKVPYSRVNLTSGTAFEAKINHMVLSMTEFTGIDANGNKQERTRSYSQSTTTGIQNWWWESESSSAEYAFTIVNLSIRKFEYTAIEEVDPVDIWSIVGAIGGIWQFVVTGFGLFFVFSEKQSPDRKMRNFRKSIAKPAIVVNNRLSFLSSRSSNQDVDVDASEEDLPAGWVKKQRANGSIYYLNTTNGSRQNESPHIHGGAHGIALPSHGNAIHRIFQPAHNPSSQASGSGAPRDTAHQGERSGSTALPPGWMERTDGEGRAYYMDTVNKTTQWKRPVQRLHSTSGSGRHPQVVDTPMAHTRRQSHSSAAPPHYSSSSGASHDAHGASARATVSIIAAAPPTAHAPPPPLGSTPVAPSYRTAVHLSNSSATAAASGGGRISSGNSKHQHEELPPPAREPPAVPAACTTADPGGGRRRDHGASASVVAADAAGIQAGLPLPPEWERRTAPNGKTYYVNKSTKTTQWDPPHG